MRKSRQCTRCLATDLNIIRFYAFSCMPGNGGKHPDAVIFDLDNTLCTFVDAKRAACLAVISDLGTGDGEELLNYFLRPVHNFEDPAHIIDYLTDIGAYTPERAERAGRIYEKIKLDTIALYPGVMKTLNHLIQAGIRIALVTDAHSVQARRRMIKLGIDHFFPVLITPDISGKRKPDHIPFRMAMDRLGAQPGSTWVVGDSLRREIAPGLEIGMITVFARYGEWTGLEFPDIHPHYVLDRFADLLDIMSIS